MLHAKFGASFSSFVILQMESYGESRRGLHHIIQLYLGNT